MCLCVSFALLQHVRRQTCENRRMLGCKTPPEREVGEITQPYLHLFGQVFSHLPSHLASPTLTHPAKVFILDSRARCRMTILVRQVPMSLVAPAAQKRRKVSCQSAVTAAVGRGRENYITQFTQNTLRRIFLLQVGCVNPSMKCLGDKLSLQRRLLADGIAQECEMAASAAAQKGCDVGGFRMSPKWIEGKKRGGKRGRWCRSCRILY